MKVKEKEKKRRKITFLDLLFLPTTKRRKKKKTLASKKPSNQMLFACTRVHVCFAHYTCAFPWVQMATPAAAHVGCVCLKVSLLVRMERRKQESEVKTT